MSDDGSWAMKLWIRKIASGIENIVCVSQIWAMVPLIPGEGRMVIPAICSPCT